jgi:hypothetical protein
MENPKLTAEQYWKWRFLIVDMQLVEKELALAETQHGGMLKDLEIARLRSAFFKHGILAAKEKSDLAKQHYQEYRASLEIELGMPLADCTIDEISYEVRKIG